MLDAIFKTEAQAVQQVALGEPWVKWNGFGRCKPLKKISTGNLHENNSGAAGRSSIGTLA